MFLPIDILLAILFWSFISTQPIWIPVTTSTMLMEVSLLVLTQVFLCRLIVFCAGEAMRLQSGIGPMARRIGMQAGWICRLSALVIFYLQLEAAGWPGPLVKWLSLDGTELGRSLLGIAPFLCNLSIGWLATYRLDRQLLAGFSNRRGHFSFRLRYGLFVLIPWVLLMAYGDVLLWLPKSWQKAVDHTYLLSTALVILGFVLVLALFPRVLVRLWQCRPLPEGALRDRLIELQERSGAPVAQIYVWRFGPGGMLNAAVVGLWPRFRYLLLSEGLLAHLNEEEILGVAAHEFGHVRRRHLWFYLLFTLIFFSFLLPLFIQSELQGLPGGLQALYLGGLTALYLRLVFGAISRRFEREADLFSLEILGRCEPLTTSLEKIAYLSGRIREEPSWHHYSIRERVAFLQNVQQEPGIGHEHRRHCRMLRAIGGIVALVLLSLALWTFREEKRSSIYDHQQIWTAHWWRVRQLMPDDSEAPAALAELALSYHRTRTPAERRQISRYLDDAQRLARSREDRKRVEQLLDRFERLGQNEPVEAP